jgi:hypothetical protein
MLFALPALLGITGILLLNILKFLQALLRMREHLRGYLLSLKIEVGQRFLIFVLLLTLLDHLPEFLSD